MQMTQPPSGAPSRQACWTTVGLTLKRNFDEYTEDERQQLLQGITRVGCLNKEVSRRLKTNPGGVYLSIPLPQTQAIHLLKLVKTGALILDEFVAMNFRHTDLRQAVLPQVNLCGIDLGGADLSRTVLSEADLHRATLRGADLTGTYARWANFEEADLGGAVLMWANLGSVNLHGAVLTGADLRGVSLSEADLREANLSGANLRGADLTGANLGSANLWGANLTGASLLGTEYNEKTRWPERFMPPATARKVDEKFEIHHYAEGKSR